MTKLQSGTQSLVMLCLVLNGVTHLAPVPAHVRPAGGACLPAFRFPAAR
jgi:hypothetical protein